MKQQKRLVLRTERGPTQAELGHLSAKRILKAHTAVIQAFDDAVDPSRLTKQEYIDFTGELIGDLQMRLEQAVQEMKEE